MRRYNDYKLMYQTQQLNKLNLLETKNLVGFIFIMKLQDTTFKFEIGLVGKKNFF